jgi:fatty-acyl-CoA synthase
VADASQQGDGVSASSPGADGSGAPPRGDADTIAELLAERATDDRPGLAFEDQRWTWAEVVRESAARASLLGELGVAGRHIGVLLENVPEYVFLLGGAALSGSVVVGINPTRRGDELARDVRHTDCALVLTDASLAPLLEGLDLGAPVRLVDAAEWGAQVDAHPGRGLPAQLPGPDALFLLIFTSGSTGAPKAVQMSQGRAARTAHAGAVAFTPADVLYCSMPLFHGNALLANLFPAMVSGASVALRQRFSASELLADVRRYGCTYFNYVGRALSYVLAQPEQPDDADNPLRWCLGSEASPRDRKEFRRRFGCFVAEGYSSSEGAVVITPFSGMPAGALGRAAEGTDVAIIDPATGEECPRARFRDDRTLENAEEAIGEIVGRSTLSSFEGYYANPQATAERSRQGWYWTGDLGYRDEDGTFFFAGRTADWLRVDGENFAAGPIEGILGRFPGVASVVVYGIPDPRTGDQVMAALELDAGETFDAAAFDRFLAEQPDLGTKWAPRFLRIVGAIPVTATGKVDRKPLRAARWATDDPVWWRPERTSGYRPFTSHDQAELRQAFRDAGREGVLA